MRWHKSDATPGPAPADILVDATCQEISQNLGDTQTNSFNSVVAGDQPAAAGSRTGRILALEESESVVGQCDGHLCCRHLSSLLWFSSFIKHEQARVVTHGVLDGVWDSGF